MLQLALRLALKLGQGLDHLKDGHDAGLLLEPDNVGETRRLGRQQQAFERTCGTAKLAQSCKVADGILFETSCWAGNVNHSH